MAAVTAHGFGELGLDFLIARTQADNLAARHVLERLGFTPERLVRDYEPAPGIRMNCVFYGMQRTE